MACLYNSLWIFNYNFIKTFKFAQFIQYLRVGSCINVSWLYTELLTSPPLFAIPQLLCLSRGYGPVGSDHLVRVYLICALHSFIKVSIKESHNFNVLSHNTLLYPSDHFICPSLDVFQLHFLSFKVHQPEPHIVQMNKVL